MRTLQHLGFLVISSVIPWVQFSSCHSERNALPQTQINHIHDDSLPLIDENRLMSLCEQQLAFGSRVPNSAAHDACKDFLLTELKKVTDTVYTQSFSSTIYSKTWRLSNIIAHRGSSSVNRVMLCAHWDSRPWSDGDTNQTKINEGIPGANDGASGVAVVLELLRCLQEYKSDLGIDVVLFDGEDIGYDGDGQNFCVGSRYFAQNFPFHVKPRLALVFDLVGDKEAQFVKEQGSVESAGPVVEKLWELGRQFAPTMFIDKQGAGLIDDHRPLMEIGIPSVDIVDIDLIGNKSQNPRRRYWHTQADDMSNISAMTMSNVVRVALHFLTSSPIPL